MKLFYLSNSEIKTMKDEHSLFHLKLFGFPLEYHLTSTLRSELLDSSFRSSMAGLEVTVVPPVAGKDGGIPLDAIFGAELTSA